MGRVIRAGVSFPEELLKSFDRIVRELGLGSRSHGIQEAIRAFISINSWRLSGGERVAGVLLVHYSHEEKGLEERLTDIQHEFMKIIPSALHLHLTEEDCLLIIEKYGGEIHAARDPTRGGLAMTLNDWATTSDTMIILDEEELPVREAVASYCEMLGMDVLALASEGVAVLGVDGSRAEDILHEIRRLGYKDARIIGEVREREGELSLVVVKTSIGGYRILEPPTGELVPRTC